jgi:hypothetical protein
MNHPLENPSLTPIGFVFPLYNKRVFQKLGEGFINGDYEAAFFWEKMNRLKSPAPLPAETIIHEIMPSIAKRGCTQFGDFEFSGRQYFSRDIMVLSTFMQWFGTNIGRSFITDAPFGFRCSHPLREFKEKFALENKRDKLIAGRIHSCDKHRCGPGAIGWVCDPDVSQVTDRDRLVVQSLMHWLGNRAGRDYMSAYNRRINRLHKRRRESFLGRNRKAA